MSKPDAITTERERSYLVTREAHQLYERSKFWDISPEMLSVIDMASGTFDRVNPAWTTTLGWDAVEIEGRPYTDFVHPEDLAPSSGAYDVAQGGAAVLRFENRYRHVDGSYRWFSWVAIPEDGKLYSSTRDVSEERSRAADRDRMWQLSTDVMLVADFGSTIVAVNPAWTTAMGWTEVELIGQPFMSFVHPDDVASTLAEVGRLSEGATTFRFENRYRRKNGTYCVLSWTAVPDDRFIHAVGRDVTAEKENLAELLKTQSELRQSQKMEAVGQLTGGLAHDFNNLLAVISGSLEMTERALAKGHTATIARFMLAAQTAVKRAAALTHRLLAFSRRQTLDPSPTDMNVLIGGMEDIISRAVGPAISVKISKEDELWTTLVDRNQLENALLNLCINAKDAMPDGGCLVVETNNHSFDEKEAVIRDIPQGQYASLCVSDTGTGMTPDVIAKAFDPFFTTKPIGEGTGLGLSMIYGFARQSGGVVRIKSQVGEGSSVRIYLPRHFGMASDIREMSLPTPKRAEQGQTVLVVDDEPGVRMLIVEVLEELGYNALEASDGISGLKALESRARIDLLVTDVGLPHGMNGRQLADAGVTVRPELKVLFITGYAENSAIGNGMLGSNMAVMTKPFAMDALANRIKEMISAH